MRAKGGHGSRSERRVLGAFRLGIGPKRCTGFMQGRQRMPCPHDASPATGKQCGSCLAQDTFRPCMICDGFACPPLVESARQACQQTHHLYLASFGGPEVKVGTASHPRRDARLIDQGPLFALRVATGPGPRIKQLEHLASTQTTLVEGMRRSRKLALLRGAMTAEEAERRVRTALEALEIVARPEHADLLHEPDPLMLPRLARQTRSAIAAEPELPVEEGRRLEGHVTGAVGHIAVIEDEGGRFVLDLGKLAGRLVDLDPPASVPKSQVQLGLF